MSIDPRSRDIEAERHIQTMAALNLACAITMGVFAAMTLFGVLGASSQTERAYYTIMAVFFGMLGGVNLILWRGLPQFSPTARVIQLLIGCVAVLSLPIGTAWGVYVFWNLLRPRGRRLFTAEYRAARLASPEEPATAHRGVVIAAVVVGVAISAASLFIAQRMMPASFDIPADEPSTPIDEEAVDEAIEHLREQYEHDSD